jgi:predicted RNase H-like nuclease
VVAGVDGARSGWICLTRGLAGGSVRARLFASAAALAEQEPLPDVIAWDVPIGLDERAPRACDRLARAALGRPRGASVFPAPLRPVLAARTHAEATHLRRAIDDRGVSIQAFGIYAKVAEVDALLRARRGLRARVYEVHPEVSFQAWNGGLAICASKKTREGRAARLALVAAHFGADAFPLARARWTKAAVADDDVLDAFAALWTAERIARGRARSLPEDPPLDGCGLPMRIVY